MLIKRIKPDPYLKKFVQFTRQKFKENLVAIVIFGSYPWGYFSTKESDYDIIILLKKPTKIPRKYLEKKFNKISVHNLISSKEMIHRAHLGHFTTYITLLKSAKTLYLTKEYKRFLRELKGLNLFELTIDIAVVEIKGSFNEKILKKRNSFKALKWALPSIRKRLQLLTYIRFHKLIWKLNKVLRKNKDLLSPQEIHFIKSLDKKLISRSKKFSNSEKQASLKILHKINMQIILHLKYFLNRK